MWFVSYPVSLYSLQIIIAVELKIIFMQFLKFNDWLDSIACRRLKMRFQIQIQFHYSFEMFQFIGNRVCFFNCRFPKVRHLSYSGSTSSESSRETGTSRKNCSWTRLSSDTWVSKKPWWVNWVMCRKIKTVSGRYKPHSQLASIIDIHVHLQQTAFADGMKETSTIPQMCWE